MADDQVIIGSVDDVSSDIEDDSRNVPTHPLQSDHWLKNMHLAHTCSYGLTIARPRHIANSISTIYVVERGRVSKHGFQTSAVRPSSDLPQDVHDRSPQRLTGERRRG
ncbi:hypothetical protein HYFRA_00003345 [Hymenoscyphus fraxineus]|uniref:Uncharacterized protein n=1 Tax=Hymenoscyphus fraxineus TaxID=746836 RepID=A0A9N9KU67_9HELO|nr:hypothetical protein HYFRA_00003345 [Hymenoscyphus fraxineus]